MKRMITMLALVMSMAFAANAASFLWSSDTARLRNADGSAMTELELGAVNTLGTFVLVYIGDGGGPDANGYTGNVGGTLVTTGKAGGLGKVSAAENFTIGDLPGSGQWNNGDNFQIKFQLAADNSLTDLYYVSDDSVVANTYTITGLADDTSALSDFLFAPEGDFYVVPEPTSMALLALGLVALGLRRRR